MRIAPLHILEFTRSRRATKDANRDMINALFEIVNASLHGAERGARCPSLCNGDRTLTKTAFAAVNPDRTRTEKRFAANSDGTTRSSRTAGAQTRCAPGCIKPAENRGAFRAATQTRRRQNQKSMQILDDTTRSPAALAWLFHADALRREMHPVD